MKYIIHKCSQNERLDNIAYKYYGNSYRVQEIIEANPYMKIKPVWEETERILIPVNEDLKEDRSNLPIWKR